MPDPVVIITGASSGIGAALAVELARQRHARIGLVARRTQELGDVASQVRDAGGIALTVSADVVDAAAIAEAVRITTEQFGPIDIAVANAGIGTPMPMRRFDAEKTNQVMRVNWEGMVNLFAACVPQMVERGSGHLVGVSSIAGFRGLPGSGPYSASKAAMTTMMEAMRPELKTKGVAVTAVHPGYIKTPLTAKNKFPMPFLMELDDAARRIERGMRRRPRKIEFPLPMVWLLKFARFVPDWMYEGVVGRRSGWA
jgi:short-subunit dehydrogenase